MIPQSRPDLKLSDFTYIREILKTGHVAKGRLVKRLERAFQQYVRIRYAAAAASGTASLHLALSALGIRPGDDVVVPSYTCASVLCAIQQAGARARLVDIEPDTLNVSRSTVSRRLTRRTKAIIVTHTFGFPAPLDELMNLGVPIVEDCATALGAAYQGRPVGSWGACSTFSLYATKMICAGEGGMVCTNSARLNRCLRDLNGPDGHLTWRRRYNYKLSDLAAGLAASQLERLPSLLARRRAIAERYRSAFSRCPVRLPRVVEGAEPNHYRFVIRTARASTIIMRARRSGIGCDRPIARPLHRYVTIDSDRTFLGTNAVVRSTVSVPLYPDLTEAEVNRIVTTMERIVSR